VSDRNVFGKPQDSKAATVLAVGANQEDLLLLRDILEADNWTVHPARSCDEARQLIARESPAVVACERELPDGTWADLYNLATALADPPPVVVVSQHSDESLWAEVLNQGGFDVLSKPFDKTEVSRVVAMAKRHGHHTTPRQAT